MTEPKGPNEFVDAAYHLVDEASMVDFYRKWAADYDHQMLNELGYTSPTKIAQQLSQHLPDTESTVFDIGCGTGLTCVFLAAKGYTNLDGIDLSPDMVRVASERGIYRELLVGDVNQALKRNDESYDAVISSGTFTHGHVGPEPLDEIFRILKPGGILACTIHQDLWTTMGFEEKLAAMAAKGIASPVSCEMDSYYKDREPEGWFCVYRKNA
ncbi:MAG: class I SAM-dependent methyltransferase [Gammaproteobacteria bacterium]|nr:class I SAM-dependent methyltransferase [Gammaproteobacteria bacterium]